MLAQIGLFENTQLIAGLGFIISIFAIILTCIDIYFSYLQGPIIRYSYFSMKEKPILSLSSSPETMFKPRILDLGLFFSISNRGQFGGAILQVSIKRFKLSETDHLRRGRISDLLRKLSSKEIIDYDYEHNNSLTIPEFRFHKLQQTSNEQYIEMNPPIEIETKAVRVLSFSVDNILIEGTDKTKLEEYQKNNKMVFCSILIEIVHTQRKGLKSTKKTINFAVKIQK